MRRRIRQLVGCAVVMTILMCCAVIGVLYFYATSYDRLIAAIERGDLEAVKREIVRGADVNRAREIHVSERHHPDLAEPLPAYSVVGVTSLMQAAWSGNEAIVEALLASGADITRTDGNGTTALDYAVQVPQNASTVRTLIQSGADPNGASGPVGWTPLIRATLFGDAAAVRAVIEAGAKVDQQDRSAGPIHYAAQQSKLAVVTMFVNAGADIEARGFDGQTPLMLATHWYYYEGDAPLQVTELLLEHGADLHVLDDAGRTALSHAAEHGNPDIVQSLIDAGAEIHAADMEGRTALMFAADLGSAEAIEVLLATGANPHVVDNAGETALDIAKASRYGDYARAHQLLEAAMAGGDKPGP